MQLLHLILQGFYISVPQVEEGRFNKKEKQENR